MSGAVGFYDTTGQVRAVKEGTRPFPVAVDAALQDAFGRLRVGNPVTLFDSKHLFDKSPLFWDESVTDTSGNATSTHSTTHAAVDMYVEAQDTIIRQTKQRFNYQPGKSMAAMLTGSLGAGGTGVKARVGAFDANDGLFFELDNATMKVVVRKATADTLIAQSAWNLDTLDGSGPSGVTLDASKVQIFFIDYEWLGTGRVRFGFVIGGRLIYCHEANYANSASRVYMSTPNLPLRYEISSAAGGGSATLQQVCSTVISEGGSESFGVLHAGSTGGTHVDADAADTIYAVLGISLKSTHLDASVHPETISIINEQGQDFEWMLLINPTVAGSFTYNAVTNSAVALAKGATANTVTAASWAAAIDGGFVKSSNQGSGSVSRTLQHAIRLGSLIDGTADKFVLAVRPLGANADIQATMTWRELL